MKQPSSPRRAVALALLVTIAAFAIILPVSAQDSTATEIDSCTTITESGTYTLTTDIENSDAETCIQIEANDVTFDGAGHTIDGIDGSGTDGIDIQGANVTVTENVVTDWETGINVDTNDVAISNSVVESNRVGIYLELVRDVTVAANEIRANGAGIYAFVSSELTIADNAVTSNRDVGIAIDDTSLSVISNNTVTGNDGAGIYLLEFAGANTLSGNDVSGNEYGLRLRSSFSTFAENTVASNNSKADFYVESLDEINLVNNTLENFTTDSAIVSFVPVVDVREIGNSTDAAIDAVDTPPADPVGLTNVGGHIELSSPVTTGRAPASSVFLEMHYDDEDVQSIDENSLRLYRYVDGEWEPVSGSSIDTDANAVSANITEFPAENFVVAPFGSPIGDSESDNGSDGGDGSEGNDGEDGPGDGSAPDGDNEDDDTKTGSTDNCRDVTVAFNGITISDLDLVGPGLSDTHVDDRTYEIGGFDIDIDGVSVTINEKDYTIGCVSVVVEPFTVTLEDITLGDA